MTRLLGIDLGNVRIGLAVGDTESGSVVPLTTIRRSEIERDANTVARIARDQRIDELVVGLPLNMDGTEGEQAARTRDWAHAIGAATSMAVTLRDERLTTEAAIAVAGSPARGSSGGPPSAHARRTHRARLDRLAAAAIVQAEIDVRRRRDRNCDRGQDELSGRPGNGQRPRRDPNEVAAQLRSRDRSDIDAHVRNHDRSAIDQHLKERERNAAAHERTLTEAQARARARATGDVRTPAFLPRGKRRTRNRWAIIVASLITLLLVATVVVPPLASGFFRSLAEANPDLMRVGLISDAVTSVMADRPDKPAGTDPTPVEFVIEPGESSADITQDLVTRGLVTDRLAFTYVLVNDGGSEQAPGRLAHAQPNHVAARGRSDPAATADDDRRRQPRSRFAKGCALEQVVAYLQTCRWTTSIPRRFTRWRPIRLMRSSRSSPG